MVINFEDLIKEFEMNKTHLQSMRDSGKRLSTLKLFRDGICGDRVNRRHEQAKGLEDRHYKTFQFVEMFKQGKSSGFLSFLEEINCGTLPSANDSSTYKHLKDMVIKRCSTKMDNFYEQKRKIRAAAIQCTSDDSCSNPDSDAEVTESTVTEEDDEGSNQTLNTSSE
jgi:hypothetical protein